MDKKTLLFWSLSFLIIISTSSYGLVPCSVAFDNQNTKLVFFEKGKYVNVPESKSTYAVFKGFKGDDPEVVDNFGVDQLEIKVNDYYFSFDGNTNEAVSGSVELKKGVNNLIVVNRLDRTDKCTKTFTVNLDIVEPLKRNLKLFLPKILSFVPKIASKDNCQTSSYKQPLGALLHVDVEGAKSGDKFFVINQNTQESREFSTNVKSIRFVSQKGKSSDIIANTGDSFKLLYNNYSRNILITPELTSFKVPVKKVEETGFSFTKLMYELGELFTQPFREFFGLFIKEKEETRKETKQSNKLSGKEILEKAEDMNKESNDLINKYSGTGVAGESITSAEGVVVGCKKKSKIISFDGYIVDHTSVDSSYNFREEIISKLRSNCLELCGSDCNGFILDENKIPITSSKIEDENKLYYVHAEGQCSCESKNKNEP